MNATHQQVLNIHVQDLGFAPLLPVVVLLKRCALLDFLLHADDTGRRFWRRPKRVTLARQLQTR
ncbi:hypothetical protein [Stigmatella aurantiaca]|uniref:Transposase n=1 Tax=Stigmatella aurantiaca (strain DW4/3-1) TaxID=378806 RepID=Q08ZE7_STIAD|nr:hypothetical protein [Stigmatella aurantiaca]ADO75332.1 uncharacterized protein STAUR_7577 [Stigmatella aurantiaca DW4/3-1]EAU65839.1 hypothetical protein STIAU_5698 [Stigmatella aurantiaca DW4/3-1]